MYSQRHFRCLRYQNKGRQNIDIPFMAITKGRIQAKVFQIRHINILDTGVRTGSRLMLHFEGFNVNKFVPH